MLLLWEGGSFQTLTFDPRPSLKNPSPAVTWFLRLTVACFGGMENSENTEVICFVEMGIRKENVGAEEG